MSAYNKLFYCFLIIFSFAVLQSIIQISCGNEEDDSDAELDAIVERMYRKKQKMQKKANFKIPKGALWDNIAVEPTQEVDMPYGYGKKLFHDPNSEGAQLALSLSKPVWEKHPYTNISAFVIFNICIAGIFLFAKIVPKVFNSKKEPQFEPLEQIEITERKVKETSNRTK